MIELPKQISLIRYSDADKMFHTVAFSPLYSLVCISADKAFSMSGSTVGDRTWRELVPKEEDLYVTNTQFVVPSRRAAADLETFPLRHPAGNRHLRHHRSCSAHRLSYPPPFLPVVHTLYFILITGKNFSIMVPVSPNLLCHCRTDGLRCSVGAP